MVYLTLYANGAKYWRCNQQYHRDNGPAITWPTGKVEYWVHGNRVTEYEQIFLDSTHI